MFNSPVFDTVIGLVFIFLLYSLLATSIKEAIATLFGLRARMLKNAIVQSMLADTPDDNRWISLFKGLWSYLMEIFRLLIYSPSRPARPQTLGEKFYEHPLIKNYGSSRFFPTPSYIPKENFSSVLVDLLKMDFADKVADISHYKMAQSQPEKDLNSLAGDLLQMPDMMKIKELLDYYQAAYNNKSVPQPRTFTIDQETLRILQMHLRNSLYSLDAFSKKIEDWFDQSMDRVSGWYKRQAQVILFLIGIFIATAFNVDTIGIATRLSGDKDARAKLVDMAVKGSDQFKDDPRVKKQLDKEGQAIYSPADTDQNNLLWQQYQAKLDTAKKLINSNIREANELLALGWDDYGRSDPAFINRLREKYWITLFPPSIIALDKDFDTSRAQFIRNLDSARYKSDSAKLTKLNDTAFVDSLRYSLFYDQQVRKFPIRVKTAYIWYAITWKKWLGVLLTAFAICLGAPFWFDLLNKLVKLRAAGKKEDGSGPEAPASAAPAPITLNVNTQTSEEAVG